MNQFQKLNEHAESLLASRGYCVFVSFFKGWDRNEDSPDHVSLMITKNQEKMFQIEFRTQFEGDEFDSFGINTIGECLDLRESADYDRRRDRLTQKIWQLKSLKSKIIFTHPKKQKELEQECAELAIFRKAFIPFAVDGIYADIPLIEESVEDLIQLVEELERLKMSEMAKKGSTGGTESSPQEKGE